MQRPGLRDQSSVGIAVKERRGDPWHGSRENLQAHGLRRNEADSGQPNKGEVRTGRQGLPWRRDRAGF